ncbi:MAG: vitamin B12 transporter [Thiomicrorhabdus sp.]|nr:MAG: vitamin B12 transporter [Thiomicrorhabdus sp.]
MKLSKLSVAILTTLSSTTTLAVSTELDRVYVTANHIQQTSHSVTANSTIITSEEIDANHFRTIDDALRSIAGINIVRNGGLGTSTSVQVRGQSNQSLLVLINGTEMTNTMGTGGAIMGNLLLSNVERIEVLKGPQSGIWGANASAGVINIITKQAQLGTQGSVTAETGSFGHKKLAVNLSSATQEGDFSVGFSELSSNGFSAVKIYETNHDDFENDSFIQTDFSLNMGINISKKHRVELLVKTANGLTDYDYTSDPDKVVSSTYQNTLRKLQYLYTKEAFESTLFISQNKITQYKDALINNYGIKGGYSYAADQSLGFIASATQFVNSANNENYHNSGIGLSNTNQFNNKKLIITESIRSDLYNQFDNKVTGKLGIKNYFTDDLYISANVGSAYNAPTLFQLTYGATNNLQPEETQGFDLSIGAYGLELSYYQSNTKNLIQYGGTYPADYYENLVGTSKFEGIEAAYHRYLDTLNTNVALSLYQGSAKDDNSEWLARRAEQTAALNLSYDGFDKLEIGVNTRYVGTMYDKANQAGAQTGEYFVTDLNLNYEATQNLTVYANILNILNEDYTHAVATYQADNVTPANVYSNGGTQLYIGLQGKL